MTRWLRTPHGTGITVITVGAILYTAIWCAYLFQRHDIFKTTAEDLGILDQAVWATAHGHFMLETICNPISDVNCLGGHMRFAIHFEPILIPISALYLLVPTPKLLLFLQTAAAASGVFPAFLLAERRLRSSLWGVAFAALFLFCPAMQTAVVYDFHPEVFAAPLLLWTLYCLETRRDRGLIATCVVAVLCKETIALEVLCIGVYIVVAKRRRRLGALVSVLGAGALALALLIMRLTSPIGRSPVATRFDPLLHDPFHILPQILTDPARYTYLIGLFGQTGFLALLSPWMVAVALPSIAVNWFSSNPTMYSGGVQYDVHLAPLLIAGAIDGVAWLQVVLPRTVFPQVRAYLGVWPQRARARLEGAVGWLQGRVSAARWHPPHLAASYGALATVVVVALCALGLQQSVSNDYQQYVRSGGWPVQTAHVRLGKQLLKLIPSTASVSAESELVPHLSERTGIYQFPTGVSRAQYIMLDVTTGSFYPYKDADDYATELNNLLASGNFQLLAADNGYLLLRRWSPSQLADDGQPVALPASFFNFETDASLSPSATSLTQFLRAAQSLGFDTVAQPAAAGKANP